MIGGEEDFAIDKIADYALRGQGDITAVHSILYKDETGAIRKNQFHVWDEDLDGQPFPARHLMNNKLYTRPDTDEPMACRRRFPENGCGFEAPGTCWTR